jgi:hypothetical protein
MQKATSARIDEVNRPRVQTRAPSEDEIAGARAIAAVSEHRGPIRAKTLRPYAAARAIVAADAARRLDISKQRRQQIRTIAALEPSWGKRLDALGASHRAIRWVAAPDPAERPVDVEYRYRALARLLEGTGPHRTFRELCDATTSYDPHTGAELPPVAGEQHDR